MHLQWGYPKKNQSLVYWIAEITSWKLWELSPPQHLNLSLVEKCILGIILDQYYSHTSSTSESRHYLDCALVEELSISGFASGKIHFEQTGNTERISSESSSINKDWDVFKLFSTGLEGIYRSGVLSLCNGFKLAALSLEMDWTLFFHELEIAFFPLDRGKHSSVTSLRLLHCSSGIP